ncbi:MAG: 2-keto-4-pentenoate hydratase [Dongiaceae bacterium]
MEQRRIDQAAEFLWSAWQDRRLIEALPPESRPADLAEGYEVQRALGKLAGPTLGWKIAATSVAGQRHIGVDGPLAGRLYSRYAHGAGISLPAGHLNMRVAEAEFAFRMGGGLPPRGRAYSQDEVMAAVASLHLAIEVPDSRYRDFVKVGAPSLVADDACAGFWLRGEETNGWRDLDLAAHAVAARKNGAAAGTGSGANVLGDPRIALTWLANDLNGRGDGLKPGELITTGTCVPPVTIAPGDRIEMDFGGLGTIEVSFRE